ncbi:hypothetical protein MMC32_001276 [Xylographa parallela]|nr:hypothetical protein [Xylographa parallela]
MWRLPTDEQKKANPRRMLPPNQMIEEYHSQQLLPGGQLSTTSTIFINYINDRVRWQSQAFHQDRPFILEASPSSITVDVLGWTTFTFVHALTEIYYGPSLLASAPELLESFQDWEKTNWKFMFQTPGIMSKDMSVAKGQLIDAFTTYFKKPIEQRMGANHFVSSTENELRICGLDDNELAKINMLHHWAINGNVHKVTFWVIAHLVFNPALLQAIREETAPGIVNDVPNSKYLSESCPRLQSIFYEVLRMETASSLMRFVTAPTVLGGKILRKGNNVMAPYRQLHYNQDVWGSNAADFDPDRFLEDKSLARSPSFRPFGGGVNLCPGRYLAKEVVATFVALLLSRFEIALDSGRGAQSFPRADLTTPAIGTMAPMSEDDLIIRLTPYDNKHGGRFPHW